MLVYRIEDSAGGGPYRGYNAIGYSFDHAYETHPTPWDDGITNCKRLENSDYVCGFDSARKLVAWFNKRDRFDLHKAGFSLVIYTSDDVEHGNKQIMFNARTAQKQRTLPLVA